MEQNKQQTQHPLQQLIQKLAKVITTQGRVFVGILRGLDQALNCVLSQAQQRQYKQQGCKIHQLGTYFIRGDMIVLVGQLNESQQDLAKFQQIKCKPLVLN